MRWPKPHYKIIKETFCSKFVLLQVAVFMYIFFEVIQGEMEKLDKKQGTQILTSSIRHGALTASSVIGFAVSSFVNSAVISLRRRL